MEKGRYFWDFEIMLEVWILRLCLMFPAFNSNSREIEQINWVSRPLRFAVVFQSIGHFPGLRVVLCQAAGFSSWSCIDEKITLGFCGAIGHQ